MRTSLCLILAMGVFPGILQARSALTIGGGLNVSSTSNDGLFQPASPPNPPGYTPHPSPRDGYNVGIGYERDALDWLTLGAELNLETRGEDATVTHPNPSYPTVEVELNMLYLQVPILATVKHAFGPLSVGVYGGPSVSELISGERKTWRNGVPQPTVKPDVNHTDLGLETGADFGWTFGKAALFLRPGYYWGLLDFSEDHTAKHRVGKIRLGYKFFL